MTLSALGCKDVVGSPRGYAAPAGASPGLQGTISPATPVCSTPMAQNTAEDNAPGLSSALPGTVIHSREDER